MSSDSGRSLSLQAQGLAADIGAAVDGGRLDVLGAEDMGRLMAALVRLYAERAQRDGSADRPFAGNHAVTATEALILSTSMLEATGVEPFELSLWQNMTSIRMKDASPETETA